MSTNNGDGPLKGGIGEAPAPTAEEIKARAEQQHVEALERALDARVSKLGQAAKIDLYLEIGPVLEERVNMAIASSRPTEVKSADIQNVSDQVLAESMERTGQDKDEIKARGKDILRVYYLDQLARTAGFGISPKLSTALMTSRKVVTLAYDRSSLQISGVWNGGENSQSITIARNAEGLKRAELNAELKQVSRENKLVNEFAGDEKLMEQTEANKKKASAMRAIREATRKSIGLLGARDTAVCVRNAFDTAKHNLSGLCRDLDAEAKAAAEKAAAEALAKAEALAAKTAADAYAAMTIAEKAVFDAEQAAAKEAAEKEAAEKADREQANADIQTEMDFTELLQRMLAIVGADDVKTLVDIAIADNVEAPESLAKAG